MPFVAFAGLFFVSFFFDAFGLLAVGAHRPYDVFSEKLIEATITDAAPRSPFAPLYWATGQPYFSQVGLHGRVLALVFKVWPWSRDSFFATADWFVTLGLALVLAWFFAGAWRRFSKPAVVIAAALTALSPWLCGLGSDLYWFVALWFVPFVAACSLRGARLYAVLFAAVFVKALCGYEFLSTILLAPFLALIFYVPEERSLLRRALATWPAVLAMFGGVFAAMLVHYLQLRLLFGPEGIDGLLQAAQLRTAGRGYEELFLKVSSAPMLDMLQRWNTQLGAISPFIVDDGWLRQITAQPGPLSAVKLLSYFSADAVLAPAERVAVPWVSGGVRAWSVTDVLAGTAFVALSLRLTARATWRKQRALFLFVAVSALAPMSWLVLAHGHMIFHVHIDPILFFLPTLPLAYLASVEAVVALAQQAWPWLRRQAEVSFDEVRAWVRRRPYAWPPVRLRSRLGFAAVLIVCALWSAPPREVRVLIPPLTDANWALGVSRRGPAVVVADRDVVRAIHAGDRAALASSARTVTRVEGDQLWFDGPVLSPWVDGYPHDLRVYPAWQAAELVRANVALVLSGIAVLLLASWLRRRALS